MGVLHYIDKYDINKMSDKGRCDKISPNTLKAKNKNN